MIPWLLTKRKWPTNLGHGAAEAAANYVNRISSASPTYVPGQTICMAQGDRLRTDTRLHGTLFRVAQGRRIPTSFDGVDVDVLWVFAEDIVRDVAEPGDGEDREGESRGVRSVARARPVGGAKGVVLNPVEPHEIRIRGVHIAGHDDLDAAAAAVEELDEAIGAGGTPP